VSDLHDLYRETIIDHSKRPRNTSALAQATHNAEGYNPSAVTGLVYTSN